MGNMESDETGRPARPKIKIPYLLHGAKRIQGRPQQDIAPLLLVKATIALHAQYRYGDGYRVGPVKTPLPSHPGLMQLT